MRLRVLSILLIFAVITSALSLTKLWSYSTEGQIEGITFTELGRLLVAFNKNGHGHLYVFDTWGTLYKNIKLNYEIKTISYNSGILAVLPYYGNKIVLLRNFYKWKEIPISFLYDDEISLANNGILACGTGCEFLDFNGNVLWKVNVPYVRPIYYYNGYWYAFACGSIYIIKDGSIIKKVSVNPCGVWDVAICNNQLALIVANSIYLYKMIKPTLIAYLWQDDFGSSFFEYGKIVCSTRYNNLLIISKNYNKVLIYDIKTNAFWGKTFSVSPIATAWWRDRVAIAFDDGTITVYKVVR